MFWENLKIILDSIIKKNISYHLILPGYTLGLQHQIQYNLKVSFCLYQLIYKQQNYKNIDCFDFFQF